MNTLDKIIAFETGTLSEDEIIELFQELVDSGLAWDLQGSYGRLAKALILQGLVKPKDVDEVEKHRRRKITERTVKA